MEGIHEPMTFERRALGWGGCGTQENRACVNRYGRSREGQREKGDPESLGEGLQGKQEHSRSIPLWLPKIPP